MKQVNNCDVENKGSLALLSPRYLFPARVIEERGSHCKQEDWKGKGEQQVLLRA